MHVAVARPLAPGRSICRIPAGPGRSPRTAGSRRGGWIRPVGSSGCGSRKACGWRDCSGGRRGRSTIAFPRRFRPAPAAPCSVPIVWLADLRLRVRRRAPDRLAARFANHVLPNRRQRQDPLLLQRLEHGQACLDLAVALAGAPVGMLAEGAGEVVAAGMRGVLEKSLVLLAPELRKDYSVASAGVAQW